MGLFGTRAAFVALKQAENRRMAVPDWTPTADEQRDLDRATETLEATGRYAVDHTTFAVTFLQGGGKIKVESIEDFVLFVETVEKQYPQATPGEIAGEVRQIWFGGANWEALLNSPGVSVGGKAMDIEHEPDPIAQIFDIPALKSTGHKLATGFGDVDISHVVAGIDAALNGAAVEPRRPGLGRSPEMADVRARPIPGIRATSSRGRATSARPTPNTSPPATSTRSGDGCWRTSRARRPPSSCSETFTGTSPPRCSGTRR